MKIHRIPLLLLGFVLMISSAGCVGLSLHPFYSADSLREVELTGVWRKAGGEAEEAGTGERWIFAAGEDRSLLLRVEDGEGRVLRFVARFFSLNGALFADLYPDLAALPEDLRGVIGVSLLPVHLAARVEIEPDRLKLRFLDDEWLKERLERGGPGPACAVTEEGLVLLTGPTEEIRGFLGENLEEAFAGGLDVELVRAGSP